MPVTIDTQEKPMPLVVAYEDIKPEAVIHNREGGPDRPRSEEHTSELQSH